MAAQGRVAGLVIRSASRAPMQHEIEVEFTAGGCLVGERRSNPGRGVTLLSREQWEEATAELGVALPWETRRANVLVEGLDLPRLIGRRLRIGSAVVTIRGETKPCSRMDEAHPGLQAALRPFLRGGVHGRIEVSGTVRVGDVICPEGDGK